MAVLNVRVDDQVRDKLKDLADTEGVSLSEYVRDLLLEVVMPVQDPLEAHGDHPAPESLRMIDRQLLSLLHRILARVLPEDGGDVDGNRNDQLNQAEVLEAGFAGEYWQEVAGFRTELSMRDCRRVVDILQMFRILTFSMDRLRKSEPVPKELARHLEFMGFDHNDPLEGHMAAYVEYQMRNRWSELRPQVERNDDGNSHMEMLDIYTRMLSAYRRIMDGRKRGFGGYDYHLTVDELQQIADARIHPSRRP